MVLLLPIVGLLTAWLIAILPLLVLLTLLLPLLALLTRLLLPLLVLLTLLLPLLVLLTRLLWPLLVLLARLLLPLLVLLTLRLLAVRPWTTRLILLSGLSLLGLWIWLGCISRFLFLLLFLLIFVETRETVLSDDITILAELLLLFRDVECINLYALFIERDNLECPARIDRDEIGRYVLIGGVSDFTSKDIGFEVIIRTIFCLKHDIFSGELLMAFGI